MGIGGHGLEDLCNARDEIGWIGSPGIEKEEKVWVQPTSFLGRYGL